MSHDHPEISRRNLLKLVGATAVAISLPDAGAKSAGHKQPHLYYTEAGSGRNVMFIHGWSCDSHDWSWQLPQFESKYRTVAIDLRGHGSSEVTPSGTYQPDDFVADLETLISTKYKGQKFVLIGHSMGGQIAARLAVKRPDLISAVVSVDGALGFPAEAAPVFAHTVKGLSSSNPGSAAAALFAGAYSAKTDPAFTRWHARRSQGMQPHVLREAFAPLFFGPDQVAIGAASAKFCSRVTVPLYHLCRDPAQAERMRPWFSNPKSKVDVWSDSGHWIMQDNAAAMNTSVMQWIDSI
jgi:pimeloyl-ACP methyl ester carboxylesterase